MSFFERTELLLGENYIERLRGKKIAVFGLGGVGGYAAEGLARAGISDFLLCDKDVVSESNINRQIIATVHTVGIEKTTALKERILSINPRCSIEIVNEFITRDNAEKYITADLAYVCDAVDNITAKLAIIENCGQKNIPVISSMGAGNRLDPTKVRIIDIFKTINDPLSRVMRRELKKRRIKKLDCVYSEEIPIKPKISLKDSESGKILPGSISFVPSVFGLAIASHVIKKLVL